MTTNAQSKEKESFQIPKDAISLNWGSIHDFLSKINSYNQSEYNISLAPSNKSVLNIEKSIREVEANSIDNSFRKLQNNSNLPN